MPRVIGIRCGVKLMVISDPAASESPCIKIIFFSILFSLQIKDIWPFWITDLHLCFYVYNIVERIGTIWLLPHHNRQYYMTCCVLITGCKFQIKIIQLQYTLQKTKSCVLLLVIQSETQNTWWVLQWQSSTKQRWNGQISCFTFWTALQMAPTFVLASSTR